MMVFFFVCLVCFFFACFLFFCLVFFLFFFVFDVFGFCSGTRCEKLVRIVQFRSFLVPINNLVQKWVYML